MNEHRAEVGYYYVMHGTFTEQSDSFAPIFAQILAIDCRGESN